MIEIFPHEKRIISSNHPRQRWSFVMVPGQQNVFEIYWWPKKATALFGNIWHFPWNSSLKYCRIWHYIQKKIMFKKLLYLNEQIHLFYFTKNIFQWYNIIKFFPFNFCNQAFLNNWIFKFFANVILFYAAFSQRYGMLSFLSISFVVHNSTIVIGKSFAIEACQATGLSICNSQSMKK